MNRPLDIHVHYAIIRILSNFVFLTVPMASAEFHETDTCALSCVGRQNVTLTMKHKQKEALVVVVHLRLLHGPCLLGSPLAVGSRRAISCWPLCITSNEVDQVLWNAEKRCVRAIACVDQVVYVFLLRMKPVHVRSPVNNLAHAHYCPCNESQAVFSPLPRAFNNWKKRPDRGRG